MLATRTGVQAKYFSKTIREKAQFRALWNQERRPIMEYLIGITFRDTALRNRLLSTRQSPLKECVRSWEGFWSMLTYTGQPGQNVLGEIPWIDVSLFEKSRLFAKRVQMHYETITTRRGGVHRNVRYHHNTCARPHATAYT